jgi:CTP synthase (UTP-ammonia lyase)
MTVQIGLIGDYSPEVTAHVAIPKALAIAANDTGAKVDVTWLPTESIAQDIEQLSSFNGLWCVPASPYASMDGALSAIRFARERNRPFLGTCGGFQHALIEYVRNVLEYAEADHAESNPTATMPLIAPLSCSLVGATGTIKLKEGSHISRIYGEDEVVEQYHCNYGVNVRYQSLLELGEMKVTGVDAEGEPRIIELVGHPFFIATLFQPERSALVGIRHPLINAYVQAALSSTHAPPNKSLNLTF